MRSMRAAAIGCIVALSWASPAGADRRTALAGSRLLEDPDDVWVFPELTLLHGGRLGFDFGLNDLQGAGMFLLAFEDWGVGAGVHRGDLLRPGTFFAGPNGDLAGLNGFDGLWDGVGAHFEPPAAPVVADLVGGLRIADVHLVGLRLTGGAGGTTTSPDPDRGGEVTSMQGYFGFTAGYSVRGPANVDVSAEFGWDTMERSDTQPSPTQDFGDGTAYFGGINARAFFEVTPRIDIGVLADFGVADYVQTDRQLEQTWRRRTFTGSLAAGPRIRLGENALLATYLTIGLARTNIKPGEEDEGDDDIFDTTLTAPGVHLAGEFRVFEWLYFRAGMTGSYAVHWTADPTRGSGTDYPYTFGWHAGVGFEIGDFTFDGAFTGSFLTSGPAFLGQPSPLYAIVSAAYQWGRE
ncbi:MAG: hypothetical protein HY907_04090 [Deltaproteobacteria bacterium]|nr:hypothetical protein [Deltaproteobacteria bacterium]